MAKSLMTPVLADLNQASAGVIPVDLVKKWASTKRDLASQKKLLAPFYKTGYMVSSDSAGLSKLSGSRNILDVLSFIEQPKQTIFRYGSALGGIGVGMWVADNTQMFYPDSVSADTLVTTMAAAQAAMENYTVRVGMAIHFGTYLSIGESMFGADAQLVDYVAEEQTVGGEIVLSQEVQERLSASLQKILTRRDDISNHVFYRFENQEEGASATSSSTEIPNYPAPFDKQFLEMLVQLDLKKLSSLAKISTKYAQDKVVVFIKIRHQKRELIMDQFLHWTLSNAIMLQVATDFPFIKVTSNGNLGIFVTDTVNAAIEFCKKLNQAFQDADYAASFGVTFGEVLLFPLGNDSFQIAGEPVNIASKLAEDLGQPGEIFVHDSISLPQGFKPKATFSKSVSHVTINGWVV